MADIYCIIPHFMAYKGLKSTNSVRIRFNQAEESKHEINGFLDLEYPNFDPKHGFLSSVEAEIISFCHRRQPFAFSAFFIHPLIF